MPEFQTKRKSAGQGPSRGVIIAIGVVLLLAGWGIFHRLDTLAELRKTTERQSMLTVALGKSTTAPPAEELVLPGNVQAFSDAPIYARTNGYLKRWLVDIGTPVKAGQLLAEIDTPEVDQQLNQAEADLRTAQANESLSRSTAERWQTLLKTDSVSKQETDEKLGDYASKQALTASAKANLQRLHDLQGFQRIVAPFAGTITARNTDIGQLISVGGNRELFHIADLSKLRIYVQVPQPYAPSMRVGLDADLVFAERPGRRYPAKVVNTADALDPAARTLLVQLEVDNPKGELFPGAYTEVHFKVPTAAASVRIPANALIFRGDGLLVGTLDADNKVVLNRITVGRDFGTQIEVASGLKADQSIIINPPDSLVQGVQVRVARAAPANGAKQP